MNRLSLRNNWLKLKTTIGEDRQLVTDEPVEAQDNDPGEPALSYK
jgi:hypothetical protein